MDAIWIIAGFAGFTLFVIAFVGVYALMRMASNTDREARHEEKMLNPLSDVFVTQTGQDFRLKRRLGAKPL